MKIASPVVVVAHPQYHQAIGACSNLGGAGGRPRHRVVLRYVGALHVLHGGRCIGGNHNEAHGAVSAGGDHGATVRRPPHTLDLLLEAGIHNRRGPHIGHQRPHQHRAVHGCCGELGSVRRPGQTLGDTAHIQYCHRPLLCDVGVGPYAHIVCSRCE